MDYCNQCDTCQRITFSTQAPQGLARPLPIPHQPFTHIAIDFLSLPPKVRKELGQLPHIQSRLNRIPSSLRNPTPDEITIGHNPRLIGDTLVKIPTQEETPTQRISRINQTQEIVRKRLQDAKISQAIQSNKRSEERRVGKEC